MIIKWKKGTSTAVMRSKVAWSIYSSCCLKWIYVLCAHVQETSSLCYVATHPHLKGVTVPALQPGSATEESRGLSHGVHPLEIQWRHPRSREIGICRQQLSFYCCFKVFSHEFWNHRPESCCIACDLLRLTFLSQMMHGIGFEWHLPSPLIVRTQGTRSVLHNRCQRKALIERRDNVIHHLGPESWTGCKLSVESTTHSDIRWANSSTSWPRTTSTFFHSSQRSARPSPSSICLTSAIFGLSIGKDCVQSSAICVQ